MIKPPVPGRTTRDLKINVMKIERVISWFDRKNETLIGEYNVDFKVLKL
ncbi:hypothetical protein EDF66_1307 [Sphingobacterium sp. JUb20]|nr:hypothetical protein [Sphingobacterium sp. JUb21]TCQ95085.1 hypothetical protein EDF66_1307 [Sphingobacterium sp. JUb20]